MMMMIYYDAVCVCLCVTKNHHFQFPSRPLGLAGFGRLWPSDDDDGDDSGRGELGLIRDQLSEAWWWWWWFREEELGLDPRWIIRRLMIPIGNGWVRGYGSQMMDFWSRKGKVSGQVSAKAFWNDFDQMVAGCRRWLPKNKIQYWHQIWHRDQLSNPLQQ